MCIYLVLHYHSTFYYICWYVIISFPKDTKLYQLRGSTTENQFDQIPTGLLLITSSLFQSQRNARVIDPKVKRVIICKQCRDDVLLVIE